MEVWFASVFAQNSARSALPLGGGQLNETPSRYHHPSLTVNGIPATSQLQLVTTSPVTISEGQPSYHKFAASPYGLHQSPLLPQVPAVNKVIASKEQCIFGSSTLNWCYSREILILKEPIKYSVPSVFLLHLTS